MNGNIDHSRAGDGLRERKNPQHETYETHEKHQSHDEPGDQGTNAESGDRFREKEARRKKKKTVGKTPDGSGECSDPCYTIRLVICNQKLSFDSACRCNAPDYADAT